MSTSSSYRLRITYQTLDMSELPSDIILYNILSRTPVKSLARFQCVCKQWYKYINDPYLANIHDKEEPTPIMFQQFPSSAYVMQCVLSSLRVTQGTTVKTEPLLELQRGDYNNSLRNWYLGSCNGLTLVLSSQDRRYGPTFSVINPLRKECYKLPPVRISSGDRKPASLFRLRESGGIGFDDSTNTFKIVCVFFKDSNQNSIDMVKEHDLVTMVHVLGSGSGSWREVPQVPAYPITGEGVFAHGCLHWLVSILHWAYDKGRKVVRYEIKNEKFELINLPKGREYGWSYGHDDQLLDLNGEIGFVCHKHELIEVWILKHEEWMMQACVVKEPPVPNGHVTVAGCWNKDGDILITSDNGKRLFVYRIKSKDLHEVVREDGSAAEFRMYQSSLFSMYRIN